MGKRNIPLSVPNIKGNEKKYVDQALTEEWVSSSGPFIVEFENKFKEYLNVNNACACQSGTAGLHLCLVELGIGDGDVVLVPSLTFVATINAVIYQRAIPVFFDCDDNMGIDVETIEQYLINNCIKKGEKIFDKNSGGEVKAIIPVHVFGNTCDMSGLMKLSEKYNLKIIEDATESLGTKYTEGEFAGSMTGTIGDYGVFSFNGNKIITTGGGGMVVSNDKDAIDKVRYLSTQAKDDMVFFVHNEVGFNYRLTNVQAAIGMGQLERIEEFISVKTNNFKTYKQYLSECKLGNLFDFSNEIRPNYWFYSLILNDEYYPSRDKIIKYLSNKGIQTRPIWKLNHLQKPFNKYDMYFNNERKCLNFYQRVINLPCSTNLTESEVIDVCNILNQYEED